MSHNAAGLPPHIVSFTPAVLQTPGSATIAVTGARLSTTCELELPGAFGTVTSGPVLSNFSTTTVTATWTVNILEDTDVTYTCTVSNGGLAASGVAIEIFHGFNPGNLLSSNGQWYDSTDTANANPHPASAGGADAWNPTVDWNSPAQAGFSFGLYYSIPQITTLGGKRAFTNSMESSAHLPQFPSAVNDFGAPWTMAFVVELSPAAIADAGAHIFFAYTAEFSMGYTSDGTTGHFGASHRNRNGGFGQADYTIPTIAAGTTVKYTVIAVMEGLAASTKLYVNGVLESTYTAGGFYGQSNTLSRIESEYTKPPIYGDMFFKAGALDQTEVTTLHNYWADKFGF